MCEDLLDIKVNGSNKALYRAWVWETNKAPELGYCRWAIYKWIDSLSLWNKILTDGMYHTVDRAIACALKSLPDVFCDCGGQYQVTNDEWGNNWLQCPICEHSLPDYWADEGLQS